MKCIAPRMLPSACLIALLAAPLLGADSPEPTLKNVPYGTHERQVLDVYQADSKEPTPFVFFIHGGGWVGGDKAKAGGITRQCLDAKLSVVAINYRYNTQAQEAGIKPPVQWPLGDAARALQFTRSKAHEWNLDPKRVGASGGSAGAASSLWLAFHDEMANPNSSDPIARESTRLTCAGVMGAQTCFDPKLMREWIPNTRYGGHAFGFQAGKDRDSAFDQFYAARDEVMPWIKEYSPYHWVSSDDPPVFLEYSAGPPSTGEAKDPTHSAVFGIKLLEKIKEVGGEGYVSYPDGPKNPWPDAVSFLIAKLTAK